jgi:uncharacterized YkwD family protein/spore coat assembly protein SafA
MKKALLVLLMLFCLPAQAFASVPYTVKAGDTLWRIAYYHGLTLEEILAANPQIKNPSLIYPGQKLNLPQNIPEGFNKQVYDLVNAERQKAGLSPVKYDWELSRVALHKAKDMVYNHYFSHYSPTYGSPFEMMRSYKIRFTYAGENIAKGQRTPQEVMRDWMNSPGHRANILNSNYDTIGLAYFQGVWVQMFIRKA